DTSLSVGSGCQAAGRTPGSGARPSWCGRRSSHRLRQPPVIALLALPVIAPRECEAVGGIGRERLKRLAQSVDLDEAGQRFIMIALGAGEPPDELYGIAEEDGLRLTRRIDEGVRSHDLELAPAGAFERGD